VCIWNHSVLILFNVTRQPNTLLIGKESGMSGHKVVYASRDRRERLPRQPPRVQSFLEVLFTELFAACVMIPLEAPLGGQWGGYPLEGRSFPLIDRSTGSEKYRAVRFLP
jgi:hypothetical protein